MTTQNAFTIISARRLVKVAVIAAMITLYAISANAQKLHKISLEKFKIDNKEINFTVSEVLDARRDKKIVGVIQSGLNNKPNLAQFETPGLTEIEELLKNSSLYSASNGLALRITTLKISENATIWKETGKAELSIDFFIRHENKYYYINSIFTSAEPKGIDVTEKHAANIVDVLEKSFITYSKQKNEVNSQLALTTQEMLDPNITLRNPMSMPILAVEKYKDGYYASFDEFVNNKPSIDINCRVKFSEPVKIVCNKESTNVPTLYGFAQDNKLYILYHHQFFELEKRQDTFYFYGPSRISKSPTNNLAEAYFGGASAAGSFVMPRGKYSPLYVLNMETGAVTNLTGF
jgi:hypothetical protein